MAQYGGLSLRCHRVTVYRDIKIRRTSERTCRCRLDSSKVILSHSYYLFWCPGPFQVTLSHLNLSQVILSHLESLRLLMLEVHQFKIRYTVTLLLHMCSDRFLLAFESRDLSQAEKSVIRVSSFSILQNFNL